MVVVVVVVLLLIQLIAVSRGVLTSLTYDQQPQQLPQQLQLLFEYKLPS